MANEDRTLASEPYPAILPSLAPHSRTSPHAAGPYIVSEC